MPIAIALLAACALAMAPAASGAAKPSHGAYRARRVCGRPLPGKAACLVMRLLLPGSGAPAPATGTARPSIQKTPFPGFFTPQLLHAAYGLPTEAATPTVQTIAVVDAFNDPKAEADLGVYDKYFGLPACTAANGCFKQVNQSGQTSPLPETDDGWAVEESLDVQMAHAICQSCHVLLVEASEPSSEDLGAAVNTAVAAGASEISNSYGSDEEPGTASLNSAYYNHPGLVITASSGDCGYLEEACGEAATALFPASSPDVVAVGGTTVTESAGSWSSSAWSDGGSGCSSVFAAPLWQRSAEDFSSTGCGSKRSVADVSAVADPETGVDVYDSTPNGEGFPTGWGVWGGTSVASPVVAGEFALAGGAHSVAYPVATLYEYLGNSSDLYDVVSGSNGTSCGSATSCNAAPGYDGPTGVGSPEGLGAFVPPGVPAAGAAPSLAGVAEQGQTLELTQGSWSGSPSSITDQWQDCRSGEVCTPIAGATAASYTLQPSDVGATVRVLETATNSVGPGLSVASAPSATVASNVPALAGFSPAGGITGSTITITGTALTSVSAVLFGTLSAGFTHISPTEISAVVPNGAKAGKVSIRSSFGTVASKTSFTPTLSVTGFSPKSAPVGRSVTITGVGFNSSSTVSFNGTPATSVTHVSATSLKAVVPATADTGAISVTNTSGVLGTVIGPVSFLVT
jgi:hypothetical protein